jgi:hypothetical protein
MMDERTRDVPAEVADEDEFFLLVTTGNNALYRVSSEPAPAGLAIHYEGEVIARGTVAINEDDGSDAGSLG